MIALVGMIARSMVNHAPIRRCRLCDARKVHADRSSASPKTKPATCHEVPSAIEATEA